MSKLQASLVIHGIMFLVNYNLLISVPKIGIFKLKPRITSDKSQKLHYPVQLCHNRGNQDIKDVCIFHFHWDPNIYTGDHEIRKENISCWNHSSSVEMNCTFSTTAVKHLSKKDLERERERFREWSMKKGRMKMFLQKHNSPECEKSMHGLRWRIFI